MLDHAYDAVQLGLKRLRGLDRPESAVQDVMAAIGAENLAIGACAQSGVGSCFL